MNFIRRLFGSGRKDASSSESGDVIFTRGPQSLAAPPGKEDETFLSEVALLLECEPNELDMTRDLQEGYGLDELEVIEIIQIAEDAWGVSLMPNPFTVADSDKAMSEYRTLDAIINGCKAGGSG
jgi:hypothetical protein